jgi:dienelactone hydrolase
MNNIFRSKIAAVILCSLFLVMSVSAQQGPATWKGYPPDYVAPVGSGPYPAVMEADPSLPTHTIYSPSDLAKFGANVKLPIVAFANGACANVGSMYRNFLTEIASQGFLVIAIGPVGADMSAMPRPTLPPAGAAPGARGAAGARGETGAGGGQRQLPPVATQSSQLIAAVNWALAQNSQAGSQYRGKLDPNEIALMGQSCGGIQAIEMSADPRVKTTVVLNSGLFSGPSPIPGLDVPESQLDKLHAPVAYFIGGPTDVAYAPSEHNFPLIKVPVFKADIDAGHMATYAQPNGGIFGEMVGDWLKWQLKGDKTARAQFVGADCGLCKDPKWKVESKGIL